MMEFQPVGVQEALRNSILRASGVEKRNDFFKCEENYSNFFSPQTADIKNLKF